MPNPTTLEGQTVLITGAAFDIGKALSLACARLGAHVLLLDQDSRALEAVYDEISAQGAGEATIVEVDLTHGELAATAALINQNILADHGALDALIHTANWTFPLSPLATYDANTWQQAMHNLHFAPFMLTQQLLPALNAATTARVVFSVYSCGTTPKAFWGPYGAAYAALHNTCLTWNQESGSEQTRFLTLDPGKVATQVRLKHYPAELKDTLTAPDDPGLIAKYIQAIQT